MVSVTSLPGWASAGSSEISKVTSPARADLPNPMGGVSVCRDGSVGAGVSAAESTAVAAGGVAGGFCVVVLSLAVKTLSNSGKQPLELQNCPLSLPTISVVSETGPVRVRVHVTRS